MEYIEVARLLFYFVGMFFAGLLAERLFRGKHTLSKLFALVWAAWAVNGMTLFVLLLTLFLTNGNCRMGDWTRILRLTNAAIYAATPIMMALWFSRTNNDGDRQPD